MHLMLMIFACRTAGTVSLDKEPDDTGVEGDADTDTDADADADADADSDADTDPEDGTVEGDFWVSLENNNDDCRASRSLFGTESSVTCDNCTYTWDMEMGDVDGNGWCREWVDWGSDEMTLGLRIGGNGNGRLMYYYENYGWERWMRGDGSYGDTTTTWTFDDEYYDYGYAIEWGMEFSGSAESWPEK